MNDSLRSIRFLAGGFRPFFLLGALAMGLPVLVWLPVYLGGLSLPTAFSPRDWHLHSLLFGGLPAIIAGFALTAVSNWTGRKPVAGGTLLGLVILWLAGRVAITFSALTGPLVAATIDLAFPLALVAVFAREVIAARNFRNMRVVGLVALLGLVDAAFHVEAIRDGAADYSARAAISVVLTLIMLVGGRIIPAFTRNWLMARHASKLPAGFSRLDAAVMALSALALGLWTALPESLLTSVALVFAGIGNLLRVVRWCGSQTLSEPLLAVLHTGYLTIPLGFLAVAASIAWPGTIDSASSIHIWTAGTFGVMTLAVMTRASRGHCGEALAAGRLEKAIFLLVLIGAASRVLAPYGGGGFQHLIECAGLSWSAAYLAFAVGYAPMLLGIGRPTILGSRGRTV